MADKNPPAPPSSAAPSKPPGATAPSTAAKAGTAPASAPPVAVKPAAPPPAPANDEAARKEVVRLLRGPVVQQFIGLMPELAANPDPYGTILGNYELLDGVFKLFEARRDAFAKFLVDAKGTAVNDDTVRLVCGRSVNEVIGMAVRSGMRAYAERHFTADSKGDPAVVADSPRKRWIASIAAMFRRRPDAPNKAAPGTAKRFYDAIRPALDFAWQVQFFPVYVEIPAALFEKLGIGITRLNDAAKLQRLAQLASADIGKAEQAITNPELTQEMLATNVLAAESVSQMSADEFKMMHDALAHLDISKKWDVFANKVTALQLTGDKRISKADIVAMAEHLDILNEHAVRMIIDLKIGRDQIGGFLKTAESALGKTTFLGLFGPLPVVPAEDAAAGERLKAYDGFVQSSLKALVQAMQQLEARFRRDDPKAIAECLTLVCEARRDALGAGLKKLYPLAAQAA